MSILSCLCSDSLSRKASVTTMIVVSLASANAPYVTYAGMADNQQMGYKISENGDNSNIYNQSVYACMQCTSPAYDIKIIKISGDVSMKPVDCTSEKLKNNKAALEGFLKLEDNWNAYGAHPFDQQLIEKVVFLIGKLPVQPDVFPTGRGSIQIEYEKANGEYLEFEIFNNGTMGMLYIDSNDEETESDCEYNIDLICEKVSSFYG